MSDAKTAGPGRAPLITTLKPFELEPRSTSKIPGLGGREPASDPAYAFHSAYVKYEPGPQLVQIRFSGIAATHGALTVRVNQLTYDPDPRVTTIKTWVVQIPDIVAAEGRITAVFDAALDSKYAVLGHIYGYSDVAAEGLAITVESSPEPNRVPASNAYQEKLAADRKSLFGRRMFRRANRMITEGRPNLNDPVSQPCTRPQFDEASYAECAARLGVSAARDRRQWESVFVLRALERYGLLVPNARGIGFGVGTGTLPAAMAAAGCTVIATDLPADDPRLRWRDAASQPIGSIEALRNPLVCADDVFADRVSYRPADMSAIDPALSGYDFLWSSGAIEHLGTIAAGMDFIRSSIACLKHGGLAVHTTEYNLTSSTTTLDDAPTVLFRKRDLERIAVDLVSRGHFVAQLRYGTIDTVITEPGGANGRLPDPALKQALDRFGVTSFGLIVRRGER